MPNALTREPRYLTLKLRVRARSREHEDHQSDREVAVSHHLEGFAIKHPGKDRVRKVLDSFSVTGPNGRHECLLYRPLGMNLTQLLKLLPQHKFSTELAQSTVQLLLIALDYLHQCHIVHTGVSVMGKSNRSTRGVFELTGARHLTQQRTPRNRG